MNYIFEKINSVLVEEKRILCLGSIEICNGNAVCYCQIKIIFQSATKTSVKFHIALLSTVELNLLDVVRTEAYFKLCIGKELSDSFKSR